MDAKQNYYQTAGHVFAAGIALPILCIVAVGLRFWTRKRQSQPLQMDDWLMLPATLFTLGIGISMIYGASQQSLGYRMKIPPEFAANPQETTTDQFNTTTKIQFAFANLLPLALGTVKASFLFFYKRIFAVSKDGATNILLVSLIAFVASWSIAFFFATLFECRLNFWANWGSVLDLTTHCFDSLKLVLVLCVTDFVLDLIIITIPVPMVWRLNLSTKRKIALCIVFLLGAVTVAASLARLIIMARVVAVGLDTDSILVITEYIYWGIVECATAILAACLPTLQFLLMKESFFLPAMRLGSSRSLRSMRNMFKLQTSGKSGEDVSATTTHRVEAIQGDMESLSIPLPTYRSQDHVHHDRTSVSGANL